jgi:hypothetical protein
MDAIRFERGDNGIAGGHLGGHLIYCPIARIGFTRDWE